MQRYNDGEDDDDDDIYDDDVDSDDSAKVYPWTLARQAVSQCAAKHNDTCPF